MERGREKFKRYKNIMNIIEVFIACLPRIIRIKYYDHLMRKTGILALGMRYVLIKTLAKSVGDNVSIHPNVFIKYPENLEIGNNVSIHPMCYIDALGGISIGNDVSIAHGTTLLSSNHYYHDYSMPIKDQGMENRFTKIEDNVWIGAKVSILGGVTVKEGSVVAAGAVVTKAFENNNVLAGVPAEVIGVR